MLGLCEIAYALGDIPDTVPAWCRAQRRPEEAAQALARHGAHGFHRALPGAQIELAAQATERLLSRAQVSAADIDVLVMCHTSPSNAPPSPLTLVGEVKRRLGLDRAWAFAVGQQQCVSPVHALRTIGLLFERDPSMQAAVLLCADTILVEALRPIGDAGIQSDGASAMLLRRGRGSTVRAVHTYNHARLTQGILPDGRYEADPHYLWGLISLVRQVSRAAGLRPDELTSVVPHNVNLPAWHQALDALRVPRERLFASNFARIGHAFGSDAAINLADSNALHRPGHHLVVASGIGGTFGGFAVTTH